MQAAGYAINPQYSVKILGIIENNQLQQFDQDVDNMLKEIEELNGQLQMLLRTAEEHIEKINLLEAKMSMPIPDWAKEAVSAAVNSGLIDMPDGYSYDFYRVLAMFHRKRFL